MSAEIEQRHTHSTRAVVIPGGSVSLNANVFVPSGAAGLLVLAHNAENSRSSASVPGLAAALHRNGLATLQLDLLSPSEALEDSLHGSFRFNIGLMTQRLVCGAHWITGEDEARHLPLGFLGLGTGAAAALVAAADLGKDISAGVSLGGRPDLAGNALRRVRSPTLLLGFEEAGTDEWDAEAYDLLACEKELARLPHAASSLQEPTVLDESARLAADWFRRHFQYVSR